MIINCPVWVEKKHPLSSKAGGWWWWWTIFDGPGTNWALTDDMIIGKGDVCVCVCVWLHYNIKRERESEKKTNIVRSNWIDWLITQLIDTNLVFFSVFFSLIRLVGWLLFFLVQFLALIRFFTQSWILIPLLCTSSYKHGKKTVKMYTDCI